MPNHQPQTPPQTNSAPEPATAGSSIQIGRVRSPRGLPLAALRHAKASTVPRFQGQGNPPGQAVPGGQQHVRRQRHLRRHLTDQPELRYTDGGIARATFRVAVSGRTPDSEASFFSVVV
jgi:hypothetical protein